MLQRNEDLTQALDDTEAALLSCAGQVLECIEIQEAGDAQKVITR